MFLEKSKITPQINFNKEEGILEILGRSIPENSVGFYEPILSALIRYVETPAAKTTVTIQLDYFNTSSSKSILEILKKIELIAKKGFEVEVNWLFDEDDEDMIEAGEAYDAIVKVPFNIIQSNEEFI